MRDNLSTMKDFTGLTDSERRTIQSAQRAIREIPLIPCTTCDYCAKVCPKNIGISGSFTAMNVLTVYENKDLALGREKWLVSGQHKNRANECIKCGKCEEACPQHIAIRENLDKVCRELIG